MVTRLLVYQMANRLRSFQGFLAQGYPGRPNLDGLKSVRFRAGSNLLLRADRTLNRPGFFLSGRCSG